MGALNLEQISKAFGELQAVDKLSLAIDAGAVCGLLGPNGAGKTTTIRMIMQIILPDSGSIRLFGQAANAALLDRVGYLPEERGLYRKMKVADELQFFGQLKGMSAAAARKTGLEWLERFGMSEKADTKVEELSKGNQQKIQFIACTMHAPELIILDEPFSGLDPVNAQLIKEIILELRDQGTCIIFSTHMMEQVEKLCKQICLINDGKSVLQGDLGEIKQRYPRNRILLAFQGESAFLHGIRGVEAVQMVNSHFELRVNDIEVAREVARQAAEKVTLQRFEIMEPTLDEIFIETVQGGNGPDGKIKAGE